jgi:tetratricopeptide (TPR) repeat protein
MTKDNLVYALGGVIVGIILGVVIANFSSGGRMQAGFSQPMTQTQQQTPAPMQQSESGSAIPAQGELPEGHPPVDENALRDQLVKQEAVLKNDPNNQDALVSAGNLNFDLKNYQKAAEYYDHAVKNDSNNVNLITDLGSCWLWMNQPDKAIEYYDRSLKIDPKHFQTLMNLGIARMSSGNKAGAAEAWEKLVSYYPDHPEAPMLRDAIKRLREKTSGS